MPIIAILGATGQTGQEIVTQLLSTMSEHDHHLRIYARNRSSLLDKIPALRVYSNGAANDKNSTSRHRQDAQSGEERVKVFIGDLDDTSTMRDCLSGADIILSTIASNQNTPGCSIAVRAAHSIVAALRVAQTSSKADKSSLPSTYPKSRADTRPKLVFLSSGTLNPARMADQAKNGSDFAYRLVYSAVGNVYDDILRAIAYLEDPAQQGLLQLVMAEPGALVHHAATGVELVEDEVGSDLIPYQDLAAGMIMMGLRVHEEESSESGGKGGTRHFGLRIKGEGQLGVREFLPLLRYLLPGLVAYWCPTLWRLLQDYWPK